MRLKKSSLEFPNVFKILLKLRAVYKLGVTIRRAEKMNGERKYGSELK